jgi:hypothetical protein
VANQVGTTIVSPTAVTEARLSTNNSILVSVDKPLPLAGGQRDADSVLNLWLEPGKAREVVYWTSSASWCSPITAINRPKVTRTNTVTGTNQFTETNAAHGKRFCHLQELPPLQYG